MATLDIFKKSWDKVGHDLIVVVQDFFRTGRILKDVNVIVITLSPK